MKSSNTVYLPHQNKFLWDGRSLSKGIVQFLCTNLELPGFKLLFPVILYVSPTMDNITNRFRKIYTYLSYLGSVITADLNFVLSKSQQLAFAIADKNNNILFKTEIYVFL